MHIHSKILSAAIIAAAGGLVAAQPAVAAPGLLGAYYDISFSVSNVAQALAAIDGLTPDATFVANKVCFPDCHVTANDNMSLNAFLGANASNISANSISNLSTHVMTLTGFIEIAADGVYDLGLGSDDGSIMTIGGQTLSNDGVHGYVWQHANFNLTAGLHAITIVQFENGGYTGVTAKLNNVPFETNISHNPPVPEPASWALMIGGLGVVGGAMRRRKAAVSFA